MTGNRQRKPIGSEDRERFRTREVTSTQACWRETEPNEAGRFALQLVLDNGADEHVLNVTAQDLKVILQLIKKSRTTTFDLERKSLAFF